MRLKKDWIFILVAGAVVAVLVVLSMMGREAKPVSAIPEHAGLTQESKRAECMACHNPEQQGAPAPLPATHPHVWKKEAIACTTCHKVPGASTATTHPSFQQEK